MRMNLLTEFFSRKMTDSGIILNKMNFFLRDYKMYKFKFHDRFRHN